MRTIGPNRIALFASSLERKCTVEIHLAKPFRCVDSGEDNDLSYSGQINKSHILWYINGEDASWSVPAVWQRTTNVWHLRVRYTGQGSAASCKLQCLFLEIRNQPLFQLRASVFRIRVRESCRKSVELKLISNSTVKCGNVTRTIRRMTVQSHRWGML